MNISALVALTSYVVVTAHSSNLSANVAYRLSWGDLEGVIAAPQERPNAVRVQQGSEVILSKCLSGASGWERDPLIFRLAHAHPGSTISCREKASPGLHVLFYPRADGTREAWMHFDLFGAGNRFAHSGEVLQNDLTFGRTSQAEVYRGLVKRHEDPVTGTPPSDYDYLRSFHEFITAVYAPSPLMTSIADATSGPDRYRNRVEGSLVRNGFQQSIDFAARAALRQDDSYLTSHGQGAVKRIRSALYHSLFVPGRSGDEFAFPRVAAAFGAAWVEQDWHPWRHGPPAPMKEASIILSSYVARSIWQEFKPDLTSKLRLMASSIVH